MRILYILLAAVTMVSCNTKREAVRDHYQASNVSSSSVHRDSILSSFDWLRSSDTSIQLVFLSDPDSTGSQHETARATIVKHVDESSSASSHKHSEYVSESDTTSITIDHKYTKAESNNRPKIIDMVLGAIFGSLLFWIYIKLPKQ